MLGNTLFRYFSIDSDVKVWGTLRSEQNRSLFAQSLQSNLVDNVVVECDDSLKRVFLLTQPDVVINCVGVIKQDEKSENPVTAITINALLPHRLAEICGRFSARLIQISTDCVFSGTKGMYVESDLPDAEDLYGLSKRMGELRQTETVTLRTSIIGHELNGNRSLLNWFLSQDSQVLGFSRAIFSGLPTVELARIIEKYVLPNPQLHGLFHVSAEPIDKFSLLREIAQAYSKSIEIVESQQLVIDRSLDSTVFKEVTGYQPPSWPELLKMMSEFK